MKNLIKKILNESHNEKIIGILKKRFNFTEYNNIMHFLVSSLAYGYDEANKLFAEWFKLETGLDWIDYYKSKNSILLGEKTNLFKDMFERYEYFKNDYNEVYFFDNGHHFATLYMMGRFMELRHDGSLDEHGRRKNKKLNEQLYKLLGKLSSSEPKIVSGVSKIVKPSMESVLKNLVDNYVQKFGEEEFIKLRKSLLNREISKEEFFNTLRTNSKFNLSKIDLSTKVGIKFSEKENQLINKISNDLIGKTYDQLKNMDLTLPLIRDGKTINTKIIPVNKEWVSKNMPDKIKDEMWVDGNKIFIFMDNIKGYNKNRMVTTIQHEAAHIKDPSLTKSPKLQKSYPKPEWFERTEPWTDEWVEKYYTHPFETNAINSQFFNHMSVMVKSKLNKVGKNEIIKSLDQIIDYSKGFTPTWSDLSLEILGYSGKNAKNEIVNHFKILSEKNPTLFKKLMKDLSIQSLKLKNELSRIK